MTFFLLLMTKRKERKDHIRVCLFHCFENIKGPRSSLLLVNDNPFHHRRHCPSHNQALVSLFESSLFQSPFVYEIVMFSY